jgi:hypothetical protein
MNASPRAVGAALLSALLALSPAFAAPLSKHKVAAHKAGAPVCVVAAAGAPLTMTLTFVPPTLNSNSTPITLPLTYNIYLGTTSGGETLLTSGLTSTSPYVINAGLVAGNTYYVKMAAVDSAGVGLSNDEACKTFAAAATAPTITTTALTAGVVGTAYSFGCVSTGTPSATWSATGLPAGLAMNATTGVITGTPTTAGTASVTITATYSGSPTSKTLPLVVTGTVSPPGTITFTLT